MQNAIDVLFGMSCRAIVGKTSYLIHEPNIKQHFTIALVISDLIKIIKSLRYIDALSVNDQITAISNFIILSSNYVKNIIDFDDNDIENKITAKQIFYIIKFLVLLHIETKKIEKQEMPHSDGKSTHSLKISEGVLIKVFEQFSSEYGWLPQQIYSQLTMRQMYAYWGALNKRKRSDIETQAALHGAKLKHDGDIHLDAANAKALAQSGIILKADDITQNLQIQEGDHKKLQLLMIYMGIPYPKDVNFHQFESSFRNILHVQILTLRDKGKWIYPDYNKDIVEQVIGVNSKDIPNLLKRAQELGVQIDPGFDIQKHKLELIKLICVAKRRKEKFLEDIKLPPKR